jgi:hypothetical protein
MSIKDNLNDKDSPAKSLTCKVHNAKRQEEQEGIHKGVVSSFRRLDGLPLIETADGKALILKEFETKPELGEEIEYIITVKHGSVMYGKRVK